jgi:hypothetical protein
MTVTDHISEVRHGEVFLRSGDLVKVAPGKAKGDTFVGRFLYAAVDEAGMYYRLIELDAHGWDKSFRSITPGRCKRLSEKKQHSGQ